MSDTEAGAAVKLANFDEIDRARRLLDLGDTATLRDIKQSYRQKAFQHHPDTGEAEQQGEETMKDLNWAYKLLMEYCDTYSYSFKEEDVARAYPHDEYIRKYYYGWFEGI
jgi:hypothetical protein